MNYMFCKYRIECKQVCKENELHTENETQCVKMDKYLF